MDTELKDILSRGLIITERYQGGDFMGVEYDFRPWLEKALEDYYRKKAGPKKSPFMVTKVCPDCDEKPSKVLKRVYHQFSFQPKDWIQDDENTVHVKVGDLEAAVTQTDYYEDTLTPCQRAAQKLIMYSGYPKLKNVVLSGKKLVFEYEKISSS